ncbi:MAG: tetratricopeptide repeat protein [Rhodospirillales bacterium]|nr:tetratricopeptide repeat protein [Rhodospirillales bacterium]
MRCDSITDTTSQGSRVGVLVSVLAVLVLAVLASGCAGSPFAHAPTAADAGDRYQRLMRIAAAAEADGDLLAAADLYERAQATAPNRSEPVTALAAITTTLGDADGAARHWRTAVALEPDAPAARRGLGAALLALGEPADAAQQFRAAIAADPGDASAYNGLGVSLDLLGRHEEARHAYDDGLDRAPGALGLTNNRALSLALTRDFDTAIATMRTIADRPDAGPRIRQNLALVYALAGRQNEAAATAARDLPPREAQANLAFYQALQGLSGRGLAAAVFHANLEAAPASAAMDPQTAGAEELEAWPTADPAHGAAAAPAVIVDCMAADPIDPEPPVAADEAPAAVAPKVVPHRGPVAFAEPSRAARSAVRALRFAWTTAERGLQVAPEWFPPRLDLLMPMAAAPAAADPAAASEAATASMEPFLFPDAWRWQPVLVDVVAPATEPPVAAVVAEDSAGPDVSVTVLIDAQPTAEPVESLWSLVQVGHRSDGASTAAARAGIGTAPAGQVPAVLPATARPHPSIFADSGSGPAAPPAGPAPPADATVGLVAVRAREGPPFLPAQP